MEAVHNQKGRFEYESKNLSTNLVIDWILMVILGVTTGTWFQRSLQLASFVILKVGVLMTDVAVSVKQGYLEH